MRTAAALACALAALLMGGCVSAPRDAAGLAAYREANDPLEPMNRRIFAFNLGVDRYVIRPIAKGYVEAVPQGGRDGIRHFVDNIGEPVVIANEILQVQFRRAAVSSGRFILNSTIGVLGFFDFAGHHGLTRQTGDFGQTLHAWGASEGPYLVIPLFGPSNPRDAVGLSVDVYLDPVRYVLKQEQEELPLWVRYAPAIVGGVDERARSLDALDAIEKDSVDYYAALRSLFRQNRAAQLRGDDVSLMPTETGLYDDPAEEPAGKGPPSRP